MFLTVISSKQYIGEPLACFCPAHFTGAHVEYTNNICWISKAFYVPVDTVFSYSSSQTTTLNPFFKDDSHHFLNSSHMKFVRVDNLIAYYPFLLIGQALLFYLPYFIWKNVINKSPYDIGTLILIAYESQFSESQVHREKTLRYLIKHLDRANEFYNAKKKIEQGADLHPNSASLWPNTANNERSNYDKELNTKIKDLDETDSKFSSLFKNFKQIINNKNENDSIHNRHKSSKNSEEEDLYKPKSGDFLPRTIRKETTYLENPKTTHYQFYAKLLFIVYLIIKILYIVNCLAQFLFLNKFIASDNKQEKYVTDKNEMIRSDNTYIASRNIWRGFEFGYKSMANLIETGNLFGEKTRLLIFHTVIFCDFKIRMLGDRLHRHTVQCVVPVNIFSEKIFTALWFWMFFLNFVNFYNLVKWVAYFLSFNVRLNFIKNHLFSSSSNVLSANEKLLSNFARNLFNNSKPGNTANTTESEHADYLARRLNNFKKNETSIKAIRTMTCNYLMHDNILILKLIEINTNQMISRELIALLFENYLRKTTPYDENTV